MKILFITRLFHPHVGGVEKHVLNLSLQLIKDGHSVTILTTKHDKKLASQEKYKNIQIIRIDESGGLFSIWTKLLQWASAFKDYDVVHIHDVAIWYIPFIFIKSYYLTNHGWEGVYPIPLKNIIIKSISTRLAKKSISVGKYLDKYYNLNSDLVTYGAINPSKPKRKKKQIVYVGRLAGDTGLKIHLKTLKHFKNYKIIFCGDGELREECKKLGKVLGFTNPEKYLKESQVCFASGYLTILESLSNKCITVNAYDNKFKKDVFESTPFAPWTVLDNDPKRFKTKINKLLKNKKSTQKMLEKAKKWADSQTWDKLKNDYYQLWDLKNNSQNV